MVRKKVKPRYIKLKNPAEVLSYIQLLLNRIRREDHELDPMYLGKIIYLLNTWSSVYKTRLENDEVERVKAEVAELRRLIEVGCNGPIIETQRD